MFDKFRIHIILERSKGKLNETVITSSTINVTSMANVNLWNWTTRPPDVGIAKTDLENSSEVPQDQAQALLQEPSSGLDSPTV